MKMLFVFLLSAVTAFAQTPEWSRKYHTGSVTCLDFSGDGEKLLSGGVDKRVIVWDIAKQDSVKSFTFPGAIQFIDLKDNDLLLTSTSFNGNNNYLYKLSDTSFKKSFAATIFIDGRVFNGPMRNVSFFKENEIIVLNSGIMKYQDPTNFSCAYLHKFSLDSLKPTGTIACGTFDRNSFTISHDKKFFHGSEIGYRYFYRQQPYNYISTEVFDIEKLSRIPYNNKFTEPLATRRTVAAVFTPDSKKLLAATGIGSIYIRDLPSCQIIESLCSQTSLATALAADMRGRYYISAHEDSTLRIWTSGVYNIFKKVKLQSPVTTIAVSPDRFHIATAHTDGTVVYWNIDYLAQYAKTDSVFTPSITQQPESKTVCRGSDVVLKTEAVANFGEEIFYQWKKNGINISDDENYSGSKSKELNILNPDNSHLGNYSALAFTSRGDSILSFTSNISFVAPLPGISWQNDTVSLKTGEPFRLSVWLHDTSKYAYQWYHDGVPVSGYKEPYTGYHNGYFYQISNAKPEKDNGIYVLKYLNECDTISSKPIRVEVGTGMSVTENSFKNLQFSAEPNPFKNSTTIHFSLEKPLKIKLAVTDILGREVAVLKDEMVEMGEQNVVFKNENLPDGMYFITLSGDGLLKTIPVQIAR